MHKMQPGHFLHNKSFIVLGMSWYIQRAESFSGQLTNFYKAQR